MNIAIENFSKIWYYILYMFKLRLYMDGVFSLYCNLFDSHLHSQNSPDGHHSVTFMAETAVDKKFLGIAITDHCDFDIFAKERFKTRIMNSEIDSAFAREAFGDRLIVSFGIEIGQVFHNIKRAESILKRHRFDFILGALHVLKYDNTDFVSADFTKMASEKIDFYLKKYFEEITDLVNWGKFDILAHFDLPWRYLKKQGVQIDLKIYREYIDEILRIIVGKGIGLELNMSGLRNNGDAMPPVWVIRRYRELGGEIVTIGSDAHSADGLGEGIGDGMGLLKDAGFSSFAFYRGRKPVMLKII